MSLYDELELPRVINACATVTFLGGSRMPPEVLAAMHDAAQNFVNIPELQRKLGEKIAAMTHNEAAYIATGAAAGIVLAIAACMTHDNPTARAMLPQTDGLRNEVLLFKSHNIGYAFAVRQTGAKMVLLGDGEQVTAAELEGAINEKTAAFIWFQGTFCGRGDLPLPEVIEICQARGVPVLIDAAAQLPPVENFWNFTQLGATAAIFSGGKDLRGPQASGLVVGKRWLIEAIRPLGNPNAGIGRPMKVGKEEMAGLYAAVKRYLALDHAARRERDERVVADWCAAFNQLPGVSAQRSFPNEAGQPLPRCEVTIGAGARLNHDETLLALRAGTPSIETGGAVGRTSFHLNPMTLSDEECKIVEERIVTLLA
jgi:D-glucosaminate-6-phosphate ammonia-lyase